MLSATLKTGLEEYGIGAKIRGLRLKKKMGLVELGHHTGLSPALLSKIERGQMFPTLPTLLRIALVFSVGLDYFFSGAREKPVVAVARKSERVALPDRPGARQASYTFEALDFRATERHFNSYFAEFFAAPDGGTPHVHPGVEFIYTVTGSLEIQVGADRYTLNAGDAIYFDSGVPHSYSRRGSRACTAVVVTTA